MPDNPYERYAQGAKQNLSQREKEGHLLLKAATAMQELMDGIDDAEKDDIITVVEYNKSLWSLFYERAEVSDDPTPLQKSVTSLSNFVFQRSRQILIVDDKESIQPLFKALISINRQIAESLMK